MVKLLFLDVCGPSLDLAIVHRGDVSRNRGRLQRWWQPATILITPVFRTTPVSGFAVKSLLIDKVRKPSGVSRQLQHSDISSLESNTNMSAHKFAPAAPPGLSSLSVPSGAPRYWHWRSNRPCRRPEPVPCRRRRSEPETNYKLPRPFVSCYVPPAK